MSYISKATGSEVTQQFEIHTRSLSDWLRELVSDKSLKDDFERYPMKKFKCEDGEEVPFIDEPLTADDCHKIQVWHNCLQSI